jgi:hypothetical protein
MSGSTAHCRALTTFSSLLIPNMVGRSLWTGDQPVARPLPTHTTTRTQNKRTHTSMSIVGFEPMISVFELAKTIHDLRPFGHCDRR